MCMSSAPAPSNLVPAIVISFPKATEVPCEPLRLIQLMHCRFQGSGGCQLLQSQLGGKKTILDGKSV